MATNNKIVILDRDGVINFAPFNPKEGKLDSPLTLESIQLLDSVPQAVKKINDLGYVTSIATNQPAAAKGKISRELLDQIHLEIVRRLESDGGKILHSHICYHRAEDGCPCRKPKPGMLEEAFSKNPEFERKQSWMVGDRPTDLQAGLAAGTQVALLTDKPDAALKLKEMGIESHFIGKNLMEFALWLERQN